MTNKNLRVKYGDFTKTDYYTYPDHFFSPWDDFTIHIPNWQVFLSRFENQPNCKFLELGTAQGRATVWLLENILTDSTSVIDTVDISHITPITQNRMKGRLGGDEFDLNNLLNLEPYISNGKCKFHLQKTSDFFKKLIDTNMLFTYDFVYVDASHEPDDVIRDAIGSFDALKTGGLLLFDDYGWKNCGRGIDGFLHSFSEKIKIHYKEYQVLVEKL